MPITRPGMNPAAKERPEKPLFATGEILATAGAAVPVIEWEAEVEDAVEEAVEPLVLAEAACAAFVELSIWQLPALHE